MKHIRQARHERAVLQPFEVELLPARVQDVVFEPGFHYKHLSSLRDVSDFIGGMSTFARSVGMLTLDPHLFANCIVARPHDLLNELSVSNAFLHEEILAHWLVISCAYDSIIIDASDELLQSDWFGMLESALIESGCSNRMTIVFLFR